MGCAPGVRRWCLVGLRGFGRVHVVYSRHTYVEGVVLPSDMAFNLCVHLQVLRRIRGFAAMNKLKKEALKVIAANLPAEEIVGLKEMFEAMDKDGRCVTPQPRTNDGSRKCGVGMPACSFQAHSLLCVCVSLWFCACCMHSSFKGIWTWLKRGRGVGWFGLALSYLTLSALFLRADLQWHHHR